MNESTITSAVLLGLSIASKTHIVLTLPFFLIYLWKQTENRTSISTFSHTLPNTSLPGTLSWPINGWKVVENSAAHANRETITILSRKPNIRRVIFARTFWPGYEATFHNIPVPLSPIAGFLLSVELPDDTSIGTLIISYHIPYIRITRIILLASILLNILIMNISPLWRKNDDAC